MLDLLYLVCLAIDCSLYVQHCTVLQSAGNKKPSNPSTIWFQSLDNIKTVPNIKSFKTNGIMKKKSWILFKRSQILKENQMQNLLIAYYVLFTDTHTHTNTKKKSKVRTQVQFSQDVRAVFSTEFALGSHIDSFQNPYCRCWPIQRQWTHISEGVYSLAEQKRISQNWEAHVIISLYSEHKL